MGSIHKNKRSEEKQKREQKQYRAETKEEANRFVWNSKISSNHRNVHYIWTGADYQWLSWRQAEFMPFDCCWPSRNWSVEYIDTVLQINTNDNRGLVLQWTGAVILLASTCKNIDDKSI